MGDQWYNEELFRQRFIRGQVNSKPVILPQTIFYTETNEGKQKQEESRNVYDNSLITIVAREKESFNIMRALYPNAKILLTPDIVLSTTKETFGVVKKERKGVLLCVRSDKEKSVDDSVWMEIEKELDSIGIVRGRTDMYSECQVTKENRLECVRMKMQEFCGAELVITDRLHGMVFATITETPCIVFSNNNHKVKGTYEWISYLPYIRYVENVEHAKANIPELLEMKNCKFDNEPLKPYFVAVGKEIKY